MDNGLYTIHVTACDSGQCLQSLGPNPTQQNDLAGRNRSYSPNSPNRSTSTIGDDSRNKGPTTSRYGSIIHTLKRDTKT